MTRPRCRCRRHRCLWPASRRPETERRKKRMPSATDAVTAAANRTCRETIGTPSWTAFLDRDQTIRRKGWLNDGKIRRQASSTMKPSAPVPFGFVFDRLTRGILRFESSAAAVRQSPFLRFKTGHSRPASHAAGTQSRRKSAVGETSFLLVYDADLVATGGGGHTDLRMTII